MMMLTEEITERKRLERELWKLAKQDSLTGLPNRLQFNELLQSLLDAAGERRKFAVGLIDVDRFKETNDILGHAAGDDLLKEVGARLQTALAPYGRVARLGGDEFAVLISVREDTATLMRAIDADFCSAGAAGHPRRRSAPLHHQHGHKSISFGRERRQRAAEERRPRPLSRQGSWARPI